MSLIKAISGKRQMTLSRLSIKLRYIIKNIGILRMTGEVTDRFNEMSLFGMALFWQKTIEFQISFRLGGIWIVGSQVGAQLNSSVTEDCLMVL